MCRGGSARTRRSIGAALALGVALAAGGCGGGTDFARHSTPTPLTDLTTSTMAPPSTAAVHNRALQATVVGAAARTIAARSAATSISVTFTGLDDGTVAGGSFDVAGTGVVDLARGDAELKLSIPVYDRLGGGGTIEQRIVSGVVYSRLPPAVLAMAKLPPAVHWLRIDARDVAAGRAALSQSQADPAGALVFLAVASDDVHSLGRATVRGAATTHYVTTIQTAPAPAGDARAAAARARLGAIDAAIGTQPVALDVWLDAAGRARRVVVSVPLAAPADPTATVQTGADAMMRIQGDYYSFGTPVKVVAPAAAEVRPYRSLHLSPQPG